MLYIQECTPRFGVPGKSLYKRGVAVFAAMGTAHIRIDGIFDFLVDMVDKGEKCPKYQAFLRQLAVNQSVNQTVNRWLFRMEVPFAGLLLP